MPNVEILLLFGAAAALGIRQGPTRPRWRWLPVAILPLAGWLVVAQGTGSLVELARYLCAAAVAHAIPASRNGRVAVFTGLIVLMAGSAELDQWGLWPWIAGCTLLALGLPRGKHPESGPDKPKRRRAAKHGPSPAVV